MLKVVTFSSRRGALCRHPQDCLLAGKPHENGRFAPAFSPTPSSSSLLSSRLETSKVLKDVTEDGAGRYDDDTMIAESVVICSVCCPLATITWWRQQKWHNTVKHGPRPVTLSLATRPICSPHFPVQTRPAIRDTHTHSHLWIVSQSETSVHTFPYNHL